MILGLSTQTFTLIHVIISLLAIASGILVLIGMLRSNRMPGWTALFLLTTVLTSVTGFLFPIRGFTPALGTGIFSLVLLGLALYGLYSKHLSGAWRWSTSPPPSPRSISMYWCSLCNHFRKFRLLRR